VVLDMRVLISAYACAPNKGSEPGLGWSVAREIARYHDTWVLTSHEHEAAIKDLLEGEAIERMRFEFLDPRDWTLDLRARRRRIPWRAHLHYYAWQVAAYRRGRSLHERVGFDIVHHVTYGRYYSPSFLSLLPPPFVWGPVGGGESAPLSFWADFGVRGIAYESLRSTARRMGEFDPFVRMTARRSAVARATTPETSRRLRAIGAKNVEIFPQVGISDSQIRADGVEGPSLQHGLGAPCFLSVARLLHWKGMHLALRAFAQARPPGVEYWIVGPGYERARLVSLAHELGIADSVRLVGELGRDEVRALVDKCVALVHPSLHDSGGVVCLEAMAAAKPVICLGVGGPATQVTDETGILVPATTPAETVRGIADAMRRLAEDPGFRTRLGRNGSERVRELFTWERRGRLLSDLYEEVLSRARD
jgi:glycosyltransferase involved in cell wall biosynthesis